MIHPWKHFWTITRHRHLVMWYCFKVGIGWQGLLHDLSKYSFTEFWRGAKYYMGTCSPTAKERMEKGYSLAWMHHKGRNKHHFEYWTDIVDQRYQPIMIPIRYLKESFCDRIAASKIYLKKDYHDGSALAYYDKTNTAKELHPNTAFVLRTWLVWLEQDGQKKTLKRVKKIKSYEDMLPS